MGIPALPGFRTAVARVGITPLFTPIHSSTHDIPRTSQLITLRNFTPRSNLAAFARTRQDSDKVVIDLLYWSADKVRLISSLYLVDTHL